MSKVNAELFSGDSLDQVKGEINSFLNNASVHYVDSRQSQSSNDKGQIVLVITVFFYEDKKC